MQIIKEWMTFINLFIYLDNHVAVKNPRILLIYKSRSWSMASALLMYQFKKQNFTWTVCNTKDKITNVLDTEYFHKENPLVLFIMEKFYEDFNGMLRWYFNSTKLENRNDPKCIIITADHYDHNMHSDVYGYFRKFLPTIIYWNSENIQVYGFHQFFSSSDYHYSNKTLIVDKDYAEKPDMDLYYITDTCPPHSFQTTGTFNGKTVRGLGGVNIDLVQFIADRMNFTLRYYLYVRGPLTMEKDYNVWNIKVNQSIKSAGRHCNKYFVLITLITNLSVILINSIADRTKSLYNI